MNWNFHFFFAQKGCIHTINLKRTIHTKKGAIRPLQIQLIVYINPSLTVGQWDRVQWKVKYAPNRPEALPKQDGDVGHIDGRPETTVT